MRVPVIGMVEWVRLSVETMCGSCGGVTDVMKVDSGDVGQVVCVDG